MGGWNNSRRVGEQKWVCGGEKHPTLCSWADTWGAREEMLHRRQATDNLLDFCTLTQFKNSKNICTWQCIMESGGECHPILQGLADEKQETPKWLATCAGKWEGARNSTNNSLARCTPPQCLGLCDPMRLKQIFLMTGHKMNCPQPWK